ncbi:MAG TPA: hypothetical protein VK455_00825 [Thermoplasmata archaeon]|nr:hypothetical protein [Thermoplasmata archaeon]
MARHSRVARRAWRRRGRRAQVSAIATLFGLLLVVTFIGNYLTTTLPGQMSSNDLNHGLLVEDQVGRLATLLSNAVSADAVGAQITQPISLGSAGEPPFQGPDGATIGPGATGASEGLSFTVSGPSVYNPPTGAPLGGINTNLGGAICPTPTSTGFSDTGNCKAIWNFTGNSKAFTIAETGSGTVAVNVTTNASTITITGTGSGGDYYQFIGTGNTISMTGVGSGKTTVSLVGSSNTLAINTVGSSPIIVYIYGNHDTVTVTSTGSGPVKIVVYGTQDNFSVPSDTGSQVFRLYLNGFNATSPSSSLCPYGNLSSTDNLTGFSETGSGGVTEYINNSVHFYHNGTGAGTCTGNATCWTTHNQNVAQTTCPFFSALSIPYAKSGVLGASFGVHLVNSYAPNVNVAFDSGAVVYAEGGGVPVMVDPPPMTYAHGALSIIVPEFQGPVASITGASTTVMALQIVSIQPIVLPGGGFSLSGPVTLTVITPYAAAWMGYFGTVSPAWGTLSCSGPAAACNGPYAFGGPLGTVTLVVSPQTFTLSLATFSISIV